MRSSTRSRRLSAFLAEQLEGPNDLPVAVASSEGQLLAGPKVLFHSVQPPSVSSEDQLHDGHQVSPGGVDVDSASWVGECPTVTWTEPVALDVSVSSVVGRLPAGHWGRPLSAPLAVLGPLVEVQPQAGLLGLLSGLLSAGDWQTIRTQSAVSVLPVVGASVTDSDPRGSARLLLTGSSPVPERC